MSPVFWKETSSSLTTEIYHIWSKVTREGLSLYNGSSLSRFSLFTRTVFLVRPHLGLSLLLRDTIFPSSPIGETMDEESERQPDIIDFIQLSDITLRVDNFLLMETSFIEEEGFVKIPVAQWDTIMDSLS